jgi:hypothetical protein
LEELQNKTSIASWIVSKFAWWTTETPYELKLLNGRYAVEFKGSQIQTDALVIDDIFYDLKM